MCPPVAARPDLCFPMAGDILQNDVSRFLHAHRGVHRQLVVPGVAPAPAGDVPVVRGPGPVRAANVALGLAERIPVDLHDPADAVLERRVDKHADDVLLILQHMIGGPPYDHAGAVGGDLPNDAVLRLYGPLDRVRTQVQVAQHIRRILMDV